MKQARSSRRGQRGVVLLIALIMLIALTLGGLALFRQVGSGVLIARNLTFSNAALVASDLGVEAARNWLVTGGANLQLASVANGYFPAWCNTVLDASGNPDADNNGVVDDCKPNIGAPPSEFNPTTYNWANSVTVMADANADGVPDDGNTVRYIIHRLCRIPGSLNFTNVNGVPQECVTVGMAGAGGSKGEFSYGNQALANTMQPYFRITVQTTGPSNTVTYSQAIIY